MGFFDFLKPKPTRVHGGETVQRALKPWLSERQQGREEISPDGRFKHEWVTLAENGDRIEARYRGEMVGYLSAEMPDCAEVVELVKAHGIEAGTVKCFADEEGGRDGWRALLTLGPHKYQPKPDFKTAEV